MTHPDNCAVCGYDKVLLEQIQQIKQKSSGQRSLTSPPSMRDMDRLLLYISKLEAQQIPCGWICHP